MWTSRSLALLLATLGTFSFQSSAFVPASNRPAKAEWTPLSSTTTPQQTTSTSTTPPSPVKYQCDVPPFNNILAANRAEIAVRIMRAATELNIATTAIYVDEDKFSQHRWGADKSFQLTKNNQASPISAYLDIPQIIQLAKQAQVDAIHPVR